MANQNLKDLTCLSGTLDSIEGSTENLEMEKKKKINQCVMRLNLLAVNKFPD